MSNKLIKLIIYFLNLPLYWISAFIPKNKNIWIFGAWFGKEYSDNSKYLYEYVKKHDKTINAIWITKDKKLYNRLKKHDHKACLAYSLKGYFYTMTAKYFFVVSGFVDINRLVFSNSTIINLWHGTPLKKIGFDFDSNFDHTCEANSPFLVKLKYLIFPFIKNKYDYTIASSQEVSKKMQTAFNIGPNKVQITGYPRNDMLKPKGNKTGETIILFLPTFRDTSKYNIWHDFNIIKINAFLTNNNCRLLYKLHFADNLTKKIEATNVNILNVTDLYRFIPKVDILITDYSSIYFDFLIVNRPIIFTPFDINEYIIKDRELYYDYNAVTPGPKCYNWDEVLDEIEKYLSGQDRYYKERARVNKLFNKYQDYHNSKRVYEFVKKLN